MVRGTTRCQAEERAIARTCGEHRIDQFMVVYSGMIGRKVQRNVAPSHTWWGQFVGIFLSNGNPLGSSGRGTTG